MLEALKSIGNALAKVASLLVGLPVGMAAAAFFGLLFVGSYIADGLLAHITKSLGTGKKTKKSNPISAAIKDFFYNATAASVNFAFLGEKTVMKYATKELGKELTLDDRNSQPTLFGENVMAKLNEGDINAFNKEIDEEMKKLESYAKFNKKENPELKQDDLFEPGPISKKQDAQNAALKKLQESFSSLAQESRSDDSEPDNPDSTELESSEEEGVSDPDLSNPPASKATSREGKGLTAKPLEDEQQKGKEGAIEAG